MAENGDNNSKQKLKEMEDRQRSRDVPRNREVAYCSKKKLAHLAITQANQTQILQDP